jgi:hypothetical protein
MEIFVAALKRTFGRFLAEALRRLQGKSRRNRELERLYLSLGIRLSEGSLLKALFDG